MAQIDTLEAKHSFVVSHPDFNEDQHCKSTQCYYSFSHKYQLCGNPQMRFCTCPHCYPVGVQNNANEQLYQHIKGAETDTGMDSLLTQ